MSEQLRSRAGTDRDRAKQNFMIVRRKTEFTRTVATLPAPRTRRLRLKHPQPMQLLWFVKPKPVRPLSLATRQDGGAFTGFGQYHVRSQSGQPGHVPFFAQLPRSCWHPNRLGRCVSGDWARCNCGEAFACMSAARSGREAWQPASSTISGWPTDHIDISTTSVPSAIGWRSGLQPTRPAKSIHGPRLQHKCPALVCQCRDWGRQTAIVNLTCSASSGCCRSGVRAVRQDIGFEDVGGGGSVSACDGVARAAQVLRQVSLHLGCRLKRHRVQVRVKFRHQAKTKLLHH